MTRETAKLAFEIVEKIETVEGHIKDRVFFKINDMRCSLGLLKGYISEARLNEIENEITQNLQTEKNKLEQELEKL